MDATGSVVLDTSVVVDYLRKLDRKLMRQLERAQDLYVPLVVLGELLYGAYKSNQREETLADVKRFIGVCTLLVPGEITADLYGQIKAGLARQGTPIPQNDIWIAALALEHKFPLATRDAHFSKVPGLTILDW